MSNCLVAYATRHGATAEIAEAIAEALRVAGHAAELRPADEVETLDSYEAVILGSAVYYGHWLDPARDLAERFASGSRQCRCCYSAPVRSVRPTGACRRASA